MSVCGIHCTVTILAWVGVATAKGDYRYKPPSFLFGAQQRAMLLACLTGALTWVSCTPVLGYTEGPLVLPAKHSDRLWRCAKAAMMEALLLKA